MSEGGNLLTNVSVTSEIEIENEADKKRFQMSEATQESVPATAAASLKVAWTVSAGTPLPPETPETPAVSCGSDQPSPPPQQQQQQQQQLPPPAAMTTTTTTHASKLPINMAASGLCRPEDRGHPERKRRLSNDSIDSSTKASESAADDNRDDDDDNDDDDDEMKMPPQDVDPERLKAFNLFVRLFIDENLDRSVPISKQPKDKVQAILEACDRQFSEFHDRARKRIRTYLKSCRRLRRTKDGGGLEIIRPTPPHLTSAIAEGILAMACENESNNAKRMRMGLEPLPAVAIGSYVSPKTSSGPGSGPGPTAAASPPSGAAAGLPISSHRLPPFPSSKLDRSSPIIQPQSLVVSSSPSSSSTPDHHPTTLEKQTRGSLMNPLPPASLPGGCYDPPSLLLYPISTTAAPQPGPPRNAYSSAVNHQRPAHYHHQHQHQHQHNPSSQPNTVQPQNGPTDLSLKSSSNNSSSFLNSSTVKNNNGSNQLNNSEMATIRQLIAGYRESAAFLYRSADELEQLLIHHK